jgi:predicted nucleic acid-binding protein
MLLDSNIIIYSCQMNNQTLRILVNHRETGCSAISYVETLGYDKISADEKNYLHRFFDTVTVYPVTQTVIHLATQLRQQRKMSLGDAIIGATALEYQQTLVTRNVKDFDWVEGLKVVDPFVGL